MLPIFVEIFSVTVIPTATAREAWENLTAKG
jgi:hypothetical protein